MVRADEPDEEAERPAVLVLGEPRRAGKMLEPQPREHLLHLATAPPLVHVPDEHAMVGVDRAAETNAGGGGTGGGHPRPVAHRPLTQAVSAAKTAWIGTRIPNTSPRYSGNGRTPPSVRA